MVSPAQRSFTFWKIIRWISLILCLLIPGTGLWFYSIAHSALPQLEGTIAISGLHSQVTVTRDAHGIPTIEAANFEDVFFAQGYVVAQDRLWQMDIMRRFAAGELAEVLGPDVLATDREHRILGMGVAAEHSATQASQRDRGFFEAYARGVNAYIDGHRQRLPVEFRILGYSPRPWTVNDSFLIGAQMVADLNHGTFWGALAREKILARLGPELTADLFVNTSRHDHPPQMENSVQGGETSPEALPEDDDEMEPVAAVSPSRLPERWRGGEPAHPGSNNWVVSGDYTVTGKPLLSNDMHLQHQMPNLWYQVHLHGGDYDVAGVALPGLPFVIVGHNQRIGWGFTNVGPTVEDLYIETFNNAGQYQAPQGWREPEHRREVIHVKGQADVTVDVKLTRHGPIISELIPGETRQLALRWTIYDSFGNPFFDVNRAHNWEEFRKALSVWGAPAQNAMYADVDGHIGYEATGKIPIRASGDGSLPANGSDNAHEWKGYIAFDDLPHVYDPPTGMLATANGRITPDRYRYSVSTEWDAPWRTERIYRVLDSGKKLAVADMLGLQTDVYSAFDAFCAGRFVSALERASGVSARARQAHDLMRDWDGRMTSDSAAAAIEYRARRELARLLLEPKLGLVKAGAPVSWKTYQWSSSSTWLENVLTDQPKRWLPDQFNDYDMLLAAAVEAAVSQADVPAKLSSWSWGSIRTIDIEHPVLGKLPLIGRWTGPGRHPASGGPYTVKQTTSDLGPSERMTLDFSDFDQSTLNLVTGEAGNFLSPYYMDQWDAWFEGHTFIWPFSKAATDKSTTHRLMLMPTK